MYPFSCILNSSHCIPLSCILNSSHCVPLSGILNSRHCVHLSGILISSHCVNFSCILNSSHCGNFSCTLISLIFSRLVHHSGFIIYVEVHRIAVFIPLILRLLQNRRESFLSDVSVREFSTAFLQTSTQIFFTTTLSKFLLSTYSYCKLQPPKHISASLKVIRNPLFNCLNTPILHWRSSTAPYIRAQTIDARNKNTLNLSH